MGPNEKELTELYEKMRSEGMQNFHVSWAEAAAELNREERAYHALQSLKEVAEWHKLSEIEKMKVQIKQVYRDLRKCDNLYRNVRWANGDFEAFKTVMENPLFNGAEAMMNGIESALMLLGNYITNEDRAEFRKEDESVKT